MNKTIKRIMIIALVTTIVIILILFVGNMVICKMSVPPKSERLYNMMAYSGKEKMDQSEVADELCIALSKYTNWDNLFLSNNFKTKFKNRKSIIDDARNISTICSWPEYDLGDDVVLVRAEKNSGLFDTDESDDITTEYYFKYILDDAGEIDDLILLEKRDVYTMSGDPVTEDNDM